MPHLHGEYEGGANQSSKHRTGRERRSNAETDHPAAAEPSFGQ